MYSKSYPVYHVAIESILIYISSFRLLRLALCRYVRLCLFKFLIKTTLNEFRSINLQNLNLPSEVPAKTDVICLKTASIFSKNLLNSLKFLPRTKLTGYPIVQYSI